jgi:membrane associated rhomboid family serine protease
MKACWKRLMEVLTPGVRVLLGVLVAVWVAAVLGQVLKAYDLPGWLVLSGPQCWHGQVWRLATYALVPAGVLDLLLNGVALALLGGLLERHWSRGEFWGYCLVAALGAGLAKAGLDGSGPLPLMGAAPMAFGLLIAWGFLCGRESILLPVWGAATVWQLILVAAGVSLLTMVFTAGLKLALIVAAGGLAGYIYLWLKHQWLMRRAAGVVHSERISRLEL